MPACIFCDKRKGSKEHLWGRWWQDYFPPLKEDQVKRFNHDVLVHTDVDKPALVPGIFSNVGHSLAKTTKVVCQKCNNGWGSRIEDRMRLAFEAAYLNSLSLSVEEVEAFRNWMFLKFCLHMRSYQSSIIATDQSGARVQKKVEDSIKNARMEIYKEFWREFRSNTVVPRGFRFFISRGQLPMTYGTFNYVPYTVPSSTLKNKRLALFCSHTCMFEVGEFQGVVTNLDAVARKLTAFPRLTVDDTRIREFKAGEAITPLHGRVPFFELEECVLGTLEQLKQGKTTKLRRTATPTSHENLMSSVATLFESSWKSKK